MQYCSAFPLDGPLYRRRYRPLLHLLRYTQQAVCSPCAFVLWSRVVFFCHHLLSNERHCSLFLPLCPIVFFSQICRIVSFFTICSIPVSFMLDLQFTFSQVPTVPPQVNCHHNSPVRPSTVLPVPLPATVFTAYQGHFCLSTLCYC